MFFDICRRREREVSVSVGTNHTRCAGGVGEGVFTFKRAVARLVLTLLQESAVVRVYFLNVLLRLLTYNVLQNIRMAVVSFENFTAITSCDDLLFLFLS